MCSSFSPPLPLIFPSFFSAQLVEHSLSLPLWHSSAECFIFAVVGISLRRNEESERDKEKKFSRKSPVRLKLQSTYICHNLYATHSNKSVGTIRGTHTHSLTQIHKSGQEKSAHSTVCFKCEWMQCNYTESHGWKKRSSERNEFKEQKILHSTITLCA